MEASRIAGLPSGERFLIDNFTYINSVIVARMFQHLQKTDFLGITVCTYKSSVHYSIYLCDHSLMQGNVVKFNQEGTRQTNKLDVYQYHPGENGIQLWIVTSIEA